VRGRLDIDILCKVVDNYGDIGFAYRLARGLSEAPDPPRLRLVVDDLAAFAALEPAVDPRADVQELRGWTLARWDAPCESFRSRRPRILLECFACGRPEWLEALIFDPGDEGGCLIIDVEHLSAEKYAEEFHRMPSLTRSPRVRKALFLPGFSPGTGGLIQDLGFVEALRRAGEERGRSGLRREILGRLPPSEPRTGLAGAEEGFWACVFSYPRDYERVVADLAAFELARESGRQVLALVAPGGSGDCFRRAWEASGRPFSALFLPFLPQEDWDRLLAASDFAIVRGEDSWARACLGGRPFLWQAYPQEGRHHLMKVEAFLGRLRPYFAPGDFSALEALYRSFNDRSSDGEGERGEESLLPVLMRYRELLGGFAAFSASVRNIGDLVAGLLTFLGDFV